MGFKCPKCGGGYNTAGWGPEGPMLGCTKCGVTWLDPSQERKDKIIEQIRDLSESMKKVEE